MCDTRTDVIEILSIDTPLSEIDIDIINTQPPSDKHSKTGLETRAVYCGFIE